MARPGWLLGGAALALAGAASAQSVGPARPTPFAAITVFGDSLSDDGDLSLLTHLPPLTASGILQKFTTNPGYVTVEDLAATFGLKTSPSVLGGNDFAVGGAGVNSNAPGTPGDVPTVTAQITGYLLASPKLDPRTLYSVWAGANDIFYHAAAEAAGAQAGAIAAQLTAGLPAAQAAAVTAAIDAQAAKVAGVAAVETPTQAGTAITTAAQQEVTLLTALHAAGATHILVFNLPDIGATPSGRAQGAAGAAGLTQLTTAYNTVLNSGLQTIGTGIVPVNANALVAEVEANPAAFGLVNVTTPACTTASSLACTPATLVTPSAASTFLFADGVHPTTAAHAVLAQYIAAELVAPAYVSLLAETPLAISTAQRTTTINELALDSTGAAPIGVRVFASAAGDAQTFTHQIYTPATRDDGESLTVGVDDRLSPTLSFGGALTYGQSSATFGDRAAKFRTEEVLATLFGQLQVLDHGYLNVVAGFGGVEFRDVERSFVLGAQRRLERGSTNASDITGAATAGWWFGFGPFKLSPYAQIQYDRVQVDGYGERGGDSSAMTFGQQTREAIVGEFGARAQATLHAGFATLAPYVQVAYDADAGAKSRLITAGLVSMPGTFTMPGFKAADGWGTVQAGIDARLTDRLSLFAAYNGRFSDRSQRFEGGQIGAKLAF